MPDEPRQFTHREVETIARLAAREATHETLRSLGMDPDNPLDAQQDMAFLRRWRTSSETVRLHGYKTALGFFIIAVIGLLVAAFRG
jgi:hypothetical protein